MSRYYFDPHNGDGQLKDEQGVEQASRNGILQEVAKTMLGRPRRPAHSGSHYDIGDRPGRGRKTDLSIYRYFQQ